MEEEKDLQELVTINGIINYLEKAVAEKKVISPSVWVDAAQKLNVLMGPEQDRLFEMQKGIAEMKVRMIEADESVAAAKAKAEATDEYLIMKKQEAKIERINQFISIAKVQARTRGEEMRGY